MITAEDLAPIRIFSSLSEAERERVARHAADVLLSADEWLIREGETGYFFVVLEGQLRLTKDFSGRVQDLHTYKQGEFFGEVPILMGAPVFASVQAVTECRLVRLTGQQLQELIRDSEGCSKEILRVMNERLGLVQRWALETPASRVLIVGSQYDTDCRDIRGFLSANRISYEWIDREREPERIPSCMVENISGPAVVVDRQTCLHGPSVREVAEALELQTAPKRTEYDVVIVGAGPAGMAAGVYGASEGLKVLMVERVAAGGQAGTSSRIENYLGFPNGISGDELSERALKQAVRFEAEIAMTREVTSVYPLGDQYCVELDGGDRVTARSVVLATGVEWRRLRFRGEDRLLSRGVLYGAARMEANSVAGKKVYIVGGGNSAGQAAVFFANYAEQVVILVRGAGLVMSMSQYLIAQLDGKCNVSIEAYTEVVEAVGEDHLEAIVLRHQAPDAESGERTVPADALFVMIGAVASTGWLPEGLERDPKGYVCTGNDISHWRLARDPYPLETSLPGVFCAGDVRHNSIKRVSSGVGEGSMAIAFIHQYLALSEPGGPSVYPISSRAQAAGV